MTAEGPCVNAAYRAGARQGEGDPGSVHRLWAVKTGHHGGGLAQFVVEASDPPFRKPERQRVVPGLRRFPVS